MKIRLSILIFTIVILTIAITACKNNISQTPTDNTQPSAPVESDVEISPPQNTVMLPEETPIAPESESIPTPETVQQTSTTPPVVEDTEPITEDVVHIGKGYRITPDLKVYRAACVPGGNTHHLFFSRKELMDHINDEINKNKIEIDTTDEITPVSLRDTLSYFDDKFFEENCLIGQTLPLGKSYILDKIVYIDTDEEKSFIDIYFSLNRNNSPEKITDIKEINYSRYYFVPVPKNLVQKDTKVNIGYHSQLPISFNGFTYRLLQLQFQENKDVLDRLKKTPEFKEYLEFLIKYDVRNELFMTWLTEILNEIEQSQ